MGKVKRSRILALSGRCAAGRQPERGLTLLEVLLGFSVLLIGLVGFVKVVVSSMAASTMTHEVAMAKETARGMLETLAASDFSNVFALYNDEPTDDPNGQNTAPGMGFAAPGLDLQSGDVDGFAGEILFPTRAEEPAVLREDIANLRFGTPRDLNGDGAIDDQDHSSDYQLLPVVVRVSWRGTAGNSRVEFRTVLVDY